MRRWGQLAFLLAICAALVVGSGALSSVMAQSEADIEAGKKLYTERCEHCHGVEGDGQGVATEYVFPRPRDFTEGVYKFRTRHETEDGNRLASDEDIYRSICEGLHGSSMPGWCGFFTDAQVRQLVHYIKTFAEIYEEDKPGQPIDYSGEVAYSAESAAKGKEYFEGDFECHTCHGTGGRGNGKQALDGLEDDWGNPIWPANLTRPWTYRGGRNRKDIFRNVVMGINGTPMPSFADPDPLTLEDPEERKEEEAAARELREKLWHVVNYVQSLWTHTEEPQPKAALTAKRTSGALPLSPDDPVWQNTEENWYPLVGQIIEGNRLFTPLVVGLGIKALHNGEDIVFRIAWDDRTESVPGETKDGEPVYADAMALQFPAVTVPGEKPYFLMGDSNHATDLWYWRNDTNKIVKLQTAGYKTFKPDGVEETGGIEGQGVVDNGQYRVVMKRTLHTKDAESEVQFAEGEFIPITMTVWDGSNGENGGDKRTVTAWYNLYLEPEPSKAPMYLAMAGIAFGLVIMSTAVYVTKNGNGHALDADGQAHGAATDEMGDHS